MRNLCDLIMCVYMLIQLNKIDSVQSCWIKKPTPFLSVDFLLNFSGYNQHSENFQVLPTSHLPSSQHVSVAMVLTLRHTPLMKEQEAVKEIKSGI